MEDKEVDGYHDLETEVAHTEGKSSRKRIVFEILIYIVALYFAAFIVPRYILQRTIVVGDSMETSLHNGENLWVEKISYHFDKLKRFDVIVFYPHEKGDDEYYIKRIIGMPGETVQIIGEDIFVNGELLKEDFGKDPIRKPGLAANPITLEEDEYFVLGDNRTVSLDSRYEEVGPVKKENIGGRAIFRLWPLNKMGPIK
ncbi:signal peptidase I [Lachnoclostridium phytofermentans]|uniref:Signal peptidase I n=1 Tax=Lachnoclostridium phytofermentans (strain ATCC 700394 / DSM 18823 / ISDg) TaxID=357809 RepID=A9KPG1_LACP7|nr:signal peptidase I [Lachnoclostridium phytofermentans]ABX43235.1 signal peptidase I [Lachnoclostridium phytofermentans ISDg]